MKTAPRNPRRSGLALALTACGGGNPLSSGPGQLRPGPAAAATRSSSARRTSPRARSSPRSTPALTAKGVTVVDEAQHRHPRDLHPGAAGRLDRPDPGVHRRAAAVLRTPPRRPRTEAAALTALQAALPDNLTVLEKSAAEDKDAIVVTRADRDQYSLKTIDDLAPRAPTSRVRRPAGVPDPPGRHPRPAEDLQLHVQGVPVAGRRRPADRAALKNGDVQAANLFTTDSTIEANDFVSLDDPKQQLRGPERPAADQQGEGDARGHGDAERGLGEADHRQRWQPWSPRWSSTRRTPPRRRGVPSTNGLG